MVAAINALKDGLDDLKLQIYREHSRIDTKLGELQKKIDDQASATSDGATQTELDAISGEVANLRDSVRTFHSDFTTEMPAAGPAENTTGPPSSTP